MSFLNGATGDPINSQIRTRLSPRFGLGVGATYRDGCINGADIGITAARVERSKITKGGAPSASLPGKQQVRPFTLNCGDMDPTNPLIFHGFANLFGKYSNTDQTTYREWIFGTDAATALTASEEYMDIAFDNDVHPRGQVYDALVTGVSVSAAANETYNVAFPCLAGRVSFFETPTQSTGSGSTLPTFHGIPDDTFTDGYTDKLRLLVTNVSSNTITCEAEISAAESFAGANTFTVTLGEAPSRMTDTTTGDVLGSQSRPLSVSWPAGATLTALDVFECDLQTGTAWTQTLPTSRALGSAHTQAYINGLPVPIEGGWSVEAAYQEGALFGDTSQEYGSTPDRSGFLVTTVTLNRRLANLVLQSLLIKGGVGNTASLVLAGASNEDISGASRPYLADLIFPALAPTGDSYFVEDGGGNKEEQVVFTAEVPTSSLSWRSKNWDSHFHAYFETDSPTAF